MFPKELWLVYYILIHITVLHISAVPNNNDQILVRWQNGIADDFNADTKPFKKILDNYYYIEEDTTLNWFAALHKCHELGAELISYENENEYDALLNHLSKTKCYWIDLTNLSKEGGYQSITTGYPPSFTKWDVGEPNNKFGDENCAQLITYVWGILKMNDNNCYDLCQFICKTKYPLQINFVV
ncbi:C-type lectin 37Da-like [Drosophila sulfurigaster albostrigata]|uniref:C-type lectin 37Da-like n=1 Tax=Drosophila sulfurigaster albostrigata TaxID=89887 RepID=UPI002D21B0ED|nr:C-type lectin 37Da-like [Drosophila sulfurigaster albostrigata]